MKRVDPKVYTKNYYLTDATGHEEFKKSHGEILEDRFQRIIKEIPIKPGMKILDIGCGRGELVFWSVKSGASEAIGIDYSKDAINLAKLARNKKSKDIKKRTKFYYMDAKKMKFKNNYFDGIYMTEVLEHLYFEEQLVIFAEIKRVLKKKGFIFIHTAPGKLFNDFTYKYWCYPLSTLLVKVNNFLLNSNYTNIEKPEKIRTESHLVMHVNEPTYFSLKKLFEKSGFEGKLKSTNVTIAKPILGWKDSVFNFLVYLNPLSYYFPFNILWGNDFYSVLRRK